MFCSVSAVPSLIPHPHLAEIEIRVGPSQPSAPAPSPSPVKRWREGGSRHENSLRDGLFLVHIPTQRKGEKGGPRQAIFLIPYPQVGITGNSW
jgi:hypothetical protein